MRNPGAQELCGGPIGSATAEGAGTATLATVIDGKALASQLGHMAQHLARLLALASVAGIAAGEPPNKDNNNHWWKEIKASLKNIKQLLKNAKSRKQVLAELQKDGRLSAKQVEEIEARLAEAAKAMGDGTPTNFLPSN
jgi:hypothetical protein